MLEKDSTWRLKSGPAGIKIPISYQVPSRGWGEDFWVQVTERQEQLFAAVVDNPLYEARLHGLELGSEIVFHEDHVLAVHGSHRKELVVSMESDDLRQFIEWLSSLPE